MKVPPAANRFVERALVDVRAGHEGRFDSEVTAAASYA